MRFNNDLGMYVVGVDGIFVINEDEPLDVNSPLMMCMFLVFKVLDDGFKELQYFSIDG